ncbi:MAG: Hint domain-containing protein [Paracoccus sp. (in: a-proteobacteria)]
MSYMIKTYTFSAPVWASSHYPFATQKDIDFTTADEQIIYLDDSDSNFETGSVYSEAEQVLLIDTELGGETLIEGTILTYKNNKISIIQDDNGNQYYVMFPYRASGSTSTPIEVGDRSTVMIVPANISTPEFDPTQSYNWFSTRSSNAIGMAETPIPPDYLTPSCFTTGTLIETASGPQAVETLVAGDLVMTRDRGLRPVSWAGGRHLSARHLDIAPNFRPIHIHAGALGIGQPSHDLVVSPQHRILVRSQIAKRLTGSGEALVPAKHLCGMPGIGVTQPDNGIGYHHILFDQHELVLSNGCWTESLYTGAQALKSVGPAARREIRALFPELFHKDSECNWNSARPLLSGRDAKELTRRHLKNTKPLVLALQTLHSGGSGSG